MHQTQTDWGGVEMVGGEARTRTATLKGIGELEGLEDPLRSRCDQLPIPLASRRSTITRHVCLGGFSFAATGDVELLKFDCQSLVDD
jgi:hypothetical protein